MYGEFSNFVGAIRRNSPVFYEQTGKKLLPFSLRYFEKAERRFARRILPRFYNCRASRDIKHVAYNFITLRSWISGGEQVTLSKVEALKLWLYSRQYYTQFIFKYYTIIYLKETSSTEYDLAVIDADKK